MRIYQGIAISERDGGEMRLCRQVLRVERFEKTALSAINLPSNSESSIHLLAFMEIFAGRRRMGSPEWMQAGTSPPSRRSQRGRPPSILLRLRSQRRR